ncbi:MAG: meso-butanediol dehydrogenase/(S,S)-butanediol dehydrogenase/diacetyl reductase [Acidimicrobiales bacterium]|jgi:meso-butanediol dehydrogenase / (S,S)-butanediol dehydrogenase / diacetyl reductase
MSNKDRVVIVTGAGSGIGRATVQLLADEGAKVIAVDLTDASLEWASSLDGVILLPGSVTDEATNAAMVDTAIEAHGRLDAVALNAGILVSGDINRGTMDDFDRVMDVNVRAVALGMKAAIPKMGDGGSIVVTGSVSGLHGDSGLFAYNASKGAVVNMARAAALDVAHLGIRVNAVCPGPTRTGMTEATTGLPIEQSMAARVPLQRFGDPAEVGAAIAFLASPAASFITGVALPVDGGVTSGTGQWATYGGRKAGFN